MTNQELEQALERLKAENAKLKNGERTTLDIGNGLSVKVSQKGAISVYGFGRWPVTLYREQMEKFIKSVDGISQFISDNSDKLTTKS
jgi:signal transduction protein with GAF and PtsI domain